IQVFYNMPEPQIEYLGKSQFLDTLYFKINSQGKPYQMNSSGNGNFVLNDTIVAYLTSLSDKGEDTLWIGISLTGCKTTSDSVGVFPKRLLGVGEITKREFFVYPNPFANTLKIESAELFDKVELSDPTGKILFEWDFNEEVQNCTLDIPEISSGVYWISISGLGQYKLIKL